MKQIKTKPGKFLILKGKTMTQFQPGRYITSPTQSLKENRTPFRRRGWGVLLLKTPNNIVLESSSPALFGLSAKMKTQNKPPW